MIYLRPAITRITHPVHRVAVVSLFTHTSLRAYTLGSSTACVDTASSLSAHSSSYIHRSIAHVSARRSYCEVGTPNTASDEPSQGVAMSVAMSVNKIKRQHQQASDVSERRKLEMDAWSQLNSLSEDAIMSSEGKAVALLLNSWAYFSKHWQRGRDGPEIEGSTRKKEETEEVEE